MQITTLMTESAEKQQIQVIERKSYSRSVILSTPENNDMIHSK